MCSVYIVLIRDYHFTIIFKFEFCIRSANVTNWSSDEERVATLSFILIDKNKNKVWERKEWKIFRELVTAARFEQIFIIVVCV